MCLNSGNKKCKKFSSWTKTPCYLFRISQHKHFRSNSCQNGCVCVWCTHMCVKLSFSYSVFSYFCRSALWLYSFIAVFANPKYVDTKLNHSFCLCGNKFRLLAEKCSWLWTKPALRCFHLFWIHHKSWYGNHCSQLVANLLNKPILKKNKYDSTADYFHIFISFNFKGIQSLYGRTLNT